MKFDFDFGEIDVNMKDKDGSVKASCQIRYPTTREAQDYGQRLQCEDADALTEVEELLKRLGATEEVLSLLTPYHLKQIVEELIAKGK